MSPRQAVASRAVWLVAVVALAGIVVGAPGCAGTRPTTSNRRDDAVVVLRSNVRDAQVYVDGRFVASLDALGGGLAVEPGLHRFELRHDDYFSTYLELTLARSERRSIVADLAPVLP